MNYQQKTNPAATIDKSDACQQPEFALLSSFFSVHLDRLEKEIAEIGGKLHSIYSYTELCPPGIQCSSTPEEDNFVYDIKTKPDRLSALVERAAIIRRHISQLV